MIRAIESVRTVPTHRAVFSDAKIVHVLEGSVNVETADGVFVLTPGGALAVGPDRWCLLRPRSRTRLWTLYADESFLRTQMGWLLPDRTRVRRGFHPHDWDGSPLLLSPGVSALRRVEPLWRQMSVLHDGTRAPEVAAARTIELFARWVGIVGTAFLAPEAATVGAGPSRSAGPIHGRLTDTATFGYVGRAVWLLRERMNEPWTVGALAEEVALSRAHLTRLFTLHTGVAPIRFLTEVRLTEFTRLIEETEQSVAHAAHTVGWTDPRIASAWFSRRFGMTPSQYRLTPHPHHVDGDEPEQSTETNARRGRSLLLGT